MNFPLFIALNAILLIRPEDLIAAISGAGLFQLIIVLCILTTLGPLRLRLSEMAYQPVTVCVLGLGVAGVLSQVVRGRVEPAVDFASDYGKSVIYYLLLISTLDTLQRLRAFLGWIVVLTVVLTGLALLQYHGFIDNPALRCLERRDVDPQTGELITVLQLRSAGIYNDSNDLCLILVTATICSLYRFATANGVAARAAWAAPIGLFGYAVILTRSRGGLIGLLLAALVWACGYFGWRKSLLAAVALLPAVGLIGGRQTNMNLGRGDTAHQRVEVWSAGFTAMKYNPITGIGAGSFGEEMGLVAHNSFVECYVETGLLGGAFFCSAFVLALAGLYTVRPRDPALAQLRPFVTAIIVGYIGGILSLSRNYIIPTYMIIGLGTSYLQLALPHPPVWLQFNRAMVLRLMAVGFAGYVLVKTMTMVLMRLGG